MIAGSFTPQDKRGFRTRLPRVGGAKGSAVRDYGKRPENYAKNLLDCGHILLKGKNPGIIWYGFYAVFYKPDKRRLSV